MALRERFTSLLQQQQRMVLNAPSARRRSDFESSGAAAGCSEFA